MSWLVEVLPGLKLSCDKAHMLCFYATTVNVEKLQTLFLILFSYKASFMEAGIHKMLVSIANMEDPGQTAYEEAV